MSLPYCCTHFFFFFFSSRRRHTRFDCDWSSDMCSSDLERARGLGRPHDLAAPEQLVPGTEQRMVETPLARQDVHEPQLDAVHGDRPRDPLERPQPPHLAEPLARVALLPQQLERQAPRSAPMPAPLLGPAAE